MKKLKKSELKVVNGGTLTPDQQALIELLRSIRLR